MKLLASAALLVSLAALPLRAEEPESQFIKHESSEAGYSVNLPVEWDVKTSVRGFDVVAFAPKASKKDEYLDNISVAVLAGKPGESPMVAAVALLASWKAKSGDAFSLVSKNELEIAGRKAARIDCAHETPSGKIRTVALFASGEDGKVVVLCLNADPKRFLAKKELFDKTEASFRPL